MRATGLHPGAVEHYRDAVAYESRYEARSEDVTYYLRRCRNQETVLEYGAGAGRLTLPLARAGLHVVAVDTSKAMLDRLKARLKSEPPEVFARVRTKQADMRTFSTRKRFDRVVAGFHTVCHLYSLDDIAAFLRHARRHLRSGGTIEFDLPLPKIDVPGYDQIAQVRVLEMEGPSGPELLTQRWYGPQEISLHLHYAGFVNIRLGADYTREPITQETSVFTVCATNPG